MLTEEKEFYLNKFVVDISYMTEQGGRPVNEDSVVVDESEENIFLTVADGLGAHGGGDIASKIAVDIAKNQYLKITKPKPKALYNIFKDIDDAIVKEQTEELKMKTTLACILCRRKWIYGAHLGDTRIYTFNAGEQIHITKDHSVAYDEVMIQNHGTLDDIRKNPNRHILKGALGVGKMRPPEFFKQKIGDNVSILICSDGFWEYVNEREMSECLKKTSTSREWLQEMLKIHSENVDIYNDNYSAICLRIIKK